RPRGGGGDPRDSRRARRPLFPARQAAVRAGVAHVPEKWTPVFRKGHAPSEKIRARPEQGCALMELPSALRAAIDQALEGISTAEIAKAAEALSQRYRSETRDGQLHLANDIKARAYLAVRLPATYAAIRAAMGALAVVRPDFAPRSMLD